MSNFSVHDGHFWLDDQPQLIQAGEFHYYRTPRDQWRRRLGLLQAAGFNAVAAYMPWIWHQLEAGVSDFDGHSHPMRDLAGFLDLAAEMGLYIIARPGPYIMAETINEGIPPWVFSHYPQVAFISQDGAAQNVVSYQHPDFLACVKDWYAAIFAVLAPRQVTRGGKIIMVQLDNEMGMIQWVRNIFDINPDTITRFAAYLESTYGAHLASRYPAGSLPEIILAGLTGASQPYAAVLGEDYRRFYRTYLRDYTAYLLAEARRNGLEVPPVINIHGFMNGGKTFPIGISQLIEAMRLPGMLSATDVYPIIIGEANFHQLITLNELTKAVHNPQQALFSIEFQAGGNQDFGSGQSSFFDLHTRLCISTGMRAINHYLFFDGENDPLLSPVKRHDWGHPVRKDGSLRRHYHRYPKLSRVLHAYGSALTLAQPHTVTTLGYLLDYFQNEISLPANQPATRVITHQREVVLYDFLGRGLSITHRPFDAVELSQADLDPTRTPHCWIMLDKACPAPVQRKLVDYARAGGKLVIAGRLPIEDFDHQPCSLLSDALGVQDITSDAPFTNLNISIFNYPDVPVSFVESYTGDFDEVFARRASGEPVGFIKNLGAGQVLVLGAALTANTLEDIDIVHQLGLKFGCPPQFTLTDWADVRLSRGPQGDFLFINNYQDDPVEPLINLGDQPLFGNRSLLVPARSGLILPLNWHYSPDVTIHYATSEITAITESGESLAFKTAQPEFFAELTLRGYTCPGAELLETSAAGQRLLVHSLTGEFTLTKSV